MPEIGESARGLRQNFGFAGDLTHQSYASSLFVRQNVDLVCSLDHVATTAVLIGDFFRDATMMIVFGADDRDIEAVSSEPLDHAIKFFNERADQIVKQIDAACDQALFRFFLQSVKAQH